MMHDESLIALTGVEWLCESCKANQADIFRFRNDDECDNAVCVECAAQELDALRNIGHALHHASALTPWNRHESRWRNAVAPFDQSAAWHVALRASKCSACAENAVIVVRDQKRRGAFRLCRGCAVSSAEHAFQLELAIIEARAQLRVMELSAVGEANRLLYGFPVVGEPKEVVS